MMISIACGTRCLEIQRGEELLANEENEKKLAAFWSHGKTLNWNMFTVAQKRLLRASNIGTWDSRKADTACYTPKCNIRYSSRNAGKRRSRIRRPRLNTDDVLAGDFKSQVRKRLKLAGVTQYLEKIDEDRAISSWEKPLEVSGGEQRDQPSSEVASSVSSWSDLGSRDYDFSDTESESASCIHEWEIVENNHADDVALPFHALTYKDVLKSGSSPNMTTNLSHKNPAEKCKQKRNSERKRKGDAGKRDDETIAFFDSKWHRTRKVLATRRGNRRR